MQDQLNPEVHLTLPSSHSPFCSQYSSQGKLFSAYSMLVLPWGFETCCLPWLPNRLKPLWSHLLQSRYYRLKISHTCIHFPVSICSAYQLHKERTRPSLFPALYSLPGTQQKAVSTFQLNEWMIEGKAPPTWSCLKSLFEVQRNTIGKHRPVAWMMMKIYQL